MSDESIGDCKNTTSGYTALQHESIGDTQSTRNDMNNRKDFGISEVYEF